MNYEFIKKLGSGAQGSVWKAIRKRDGKTVAVKIINISSKNIEYAHAINEIKKLNELSTPICHPNLLCFYGFDRSNPSKILIEMEYIDGETLFKYSKKYKGSKLYRHLLAITKDIIKGLSYMHKKNILHNDIKPENIMIDRSLTPKLVDFGLACTATSRYYKSRTPQPSCSGFNGTPIFVSPEMLNYKRRYKQSDIWSLGVTLYNAATGKFPFNFGSNPSIQKVLQIIKDPSIKPKKLNTSNKLLNTIVNRALVRDINKRITLKEINTLLKSG